MQDDPLEQGMATHSSILAWSIPWTEEPGGLESMGSQRVKHDFVTENARTGTAWQKQVWPSLLRLPLLLGLMCCLSGNLARKRP